MHEHLHKHARRGLTHGELHDWMHDTVKKQNGEIHQKDDVDQSVDTVLSVVYVTMSASFAGPTAGFVTMESSETQAAAADTQQAQPSTKATATPNNVNQKTVDPKSTQAAQPTVQTTAHATAQTTASAKQSKAVTTESSERSTHASVSSSVSSSASVSSPHTTLATSTGSKPALAGTPVQATRATDSATATATPTSAPSSGMSGGAKAGAAFGVILGLALIAGLVVFALKRKRKQQDDGHRRLDDEKSASAFGGAPAIHSVPSTAGNAPRLSLRPVTQFMGMGESKVTEMTSATGGLAPSSNRSSAWERRPSTSNSTDVSNPFGAHAERLDTAAAEKAAEQNAMNAPIPVPQPEASPFNDRHADNRPVSPESYGTNGTPPKSAPASSQVGTAAVVAIGGAGPKTTNNVHRVQLDFKPSMEDELDLHAGQVVRVLHEYDDGWALCMRMDRSKQGVAPRQCLSKMPIKPRPAGPPANGRPASPSTRNFSGQPNGRQGPGPRSPMYPAPLSPGFNSPQGFSREGNPVQGRARAHSHSQSAENTPAPQVKPAAPTSSQNHRRSASMGMLASPQKGVPTRKPVPGQAM